MSVLPVPQTDCKRLIPLLLVQDLAAAIDYYTKKLGFSPVFTWGDPPEMAGVNLGEVSVHLYEGPQAYSFTGTAITSRLLSAILVRSAAGLLLSTSGLPRP